MPEFKKVFLDATPIIYYIQRNEFFFETVKKIFISLVENNASFISSDIVKAESCVYAYRTKNFEWLNNFDNLIDLLNVEMIHTSDEIARKTAKIRAEYKSFETPDAFNLATAVVCGCDIFLTNDKRLKKFSEVKCITVEEWIF